MKITLKPNGKISEIFIGSGELARLSKLCRRFEKIVAISDENALKFWGGELERALLKSGRPFKVLPISGGEGAKALEVAQELYAKLAQENLTRGGAILSFGGGTVTDLAGFVAATFLRGVNLIHAPTTLMAQVDSSIGGKCALNLAEGKNLIGAFYQPKYVIIDAKLLTTLPKREISCGVAEIIKCGAVFDKKLFAELERGFDEKSAEKIIFKCSKIKGNLVSRDEFDEKWVRAKLNFGHTLGHAVEKLGGFSRFNHGEAVSIGMVLAAKIGEALKITENEAAEKLENLLIKYNLPTVCPYSAADLAQACAFDKKRDHRGVKMIFIEKIGKSRARHINLEVLHKILNHAAILPPL
jgi:3-dehydroquinate synthase